MKAAEILHGARFFLSEHPAIVNFRWSHSQSWGSTWTFLFFAIALYLAVSFLLHLLLRALRTFRTPIPLGHAPAVLSLSLSIISAAIFAGTLLSAVAEIRDTRWLWASTRRHRALSQSQMPALEWLLCFPLGTRPSGRVFFWSYLYYLSRFVHMVGTLLGAIRRRRVSPFHVINHSVLTFVSFLWLEFSVSFQVLAILSATLAYAALHGYRFWVCLSTRRPRVPFVVGCQLALLACHVTCHVGVLALHLARGGCNGIGAWVLNSVLNGVVMLWFLGFHVNKRNDRSKNIRVVCR